MTVLATPVSRPLPVDTETTDHSTNMAMVGQHRMHWALYAVALHLHELAIGNFQCNRCQKLCSNCYRCCIEKDRTEGLATDLIVGAPFDTVEAPAEQMRIEAANQRTAAADRSTAILDFAYRNRPVVAS